MTDEVVARREACGDGVSYSRVARGHKRSVTPSVASTLATLLGDLEPFKADHIKVGCVIDLRAIQSVTVSCTVPRCDKSERTDRS